MCTGHPKSFLHSRILEATEHSYDRKMVGARHAPFVSHYCDFKNANLGMF